jgi:hypothetical protein
MVFMGCSFSLHVTGAVPDLFPRKKKFNYAQAVTQQGIPESIWGRLTGNRKLQDRALLFREPFGIGGVKVPGGDDFAE